MLYTAKRRHLLNLQVSRYRLLALRGRVVADLTRDTGRFLQRFTILDDVVSLLAVHIVIYNT